MKFRETAIVSGGLFVQQLTVFATGTLIARKLGSDAYGILGVLKSLASVVVIVTALGLDLALLKQASLYHAKPSEFYAVARALRAIVLAVNLALLAAVFLWFGPMLAGIYEFPAFAMLCVLTMLGVVFATDTQVVSALFRVSDRVVPFALIVSFGQPIVRLVLSVLALLAGGGVTEIVCINAIVLLLTYLAIITVDRPARPSRLVMPVAALKEKIKSVLSESVWMATALLVYQMIRLMDVLILAAITGPRAAGEYAAMSSVAQLIQIYPNAISQTLGPQIALAYDQGDTNGILEKLRDYLRKTAILGGLLFGGIAVFGTDLDMVFGSSFNFPWLLCLLLAIGWYLSALLAPFGYVLSMTGRHQKEVAILASGAVLLVIGLFVLVPLWQATGAALAVLIAFAVVNGVRCAYVIRILKHNPLGLKDVAVPAGFFAIAWVCREGGAAMFERGFGALVAECMAYLVLAVSFVVVVLVTAEERRMLTKFLRRDW